MASSRRRPVLSFLIIVLNTVLLALLIELGLFIFGVEPLSSQGDVSLGFSEQTKVFERDGADFRVRAALTPTTFNEVRFRAQKPKEGLRIFVLGGSSAYGFPWSDDEAFSGHLERALARSREVPVEVVNLGGLSYAMHRLHILSKKLVQYQPDVFVVYSGHNEFVERGIFSDLRGRSERAHWVFEQLSRTRIFAAAARIQRGPPPQRDALAVERDTNHRYSVQEKQEVVEAFERELTALIQRAKANGVDVVVCTVPANLSEWRPNASISGATDPMEWSAQRQAAKQAMTAGRFDEAVRALEAARQLDPLHAETAFLLGQACVLASDFECARNAFRAAADNDSSPERRISALNEVIRTTVPNLDASVVDVEAALVARADQGLIGFNYIEDYVHPNLVGHREIAWLLYDHLVEHGLVEVDERLDRGAFDHLAKQTVEGAKTAAWHFNQGVVLENAGQPDRAERAYERALALSPEFYGALGNLALIHYRAGDRERAASYLARMLALRSDDVGARVLEANLAMDAGNYDHAIQASRLAIEIDASRGVPWMLWASALREKEQQDAALEPIRRAVELEPHRADIRLLHGVILMELAELDRAEEEVSEALRLDPEAPRAHLFMGLVFENQGRPTEAVKAYRRALSLQPGFTEAQKALHRALAESR